MKYEQKSLEGRKRIVVEIDPEVVRLGKAVASVEDIAFWQLVEKAIRKYIKGSDLGGNT